MVNRPRTFFDLQVYSHPSRGWRVNEFYIAQLFIAKLFIANCQLPNANFQDVCQSASIGNLAIGNWQCLKPDGGRLFDDMTVTHLHDALAHGRRFGIVSDHHDRLIEPVIQLLEHVKDEG